MSLLLAACLLSATADFDIRYAKSTTGVGSIDTQGAIVISLAESLLTLIKNEFPEYHLPTEDDYKLDWKTYRNSFPVPFLAFGDFNGDGAQDTAALLLSNKKDDVWKLVVFHRNEGGDYQAKVVKSSPETENSKNKGRLYGPAQRHGLTASSQCGKNPCLNFFVFESASFLYVWNGKKYVEINVAD